MRRNQIALGIVLSITALLAAGCTTASLPAEAPAPQATAPASATPAPLPATVTPQPSPTALPPSPTPLVAMDIRAMRAGSYPGSEIIIDRELSPGSGYRRYIASYQSDGLKIFALLTVPTTPRPEGGYPVIVFNHGYIPPKEYRSDERYVLYVDGLARNGYIVFRPDYRGHGFSEGEARGAYAYPDYAVDVLNALASIRKYPDANPERVGMWGHSLGGYLTLRAMVIDPGIRVGVIWAGVVGSYADLLNKWRAAPPPELGSAVRRWRSEYVERFGSPEENPAFWNAVSANAYLNELSGPVQLHHSPEDEEVPYEFSQTLEQQIQAAGGVVEFYTYPGNDHNLRQDFSTAMQRTVAFFDRYLKE